MRLQGHCQGGSPGFPWLRLNSWTENGTADRGKAALARSGCGSDNGRLNMEQKDTRNLIEALYKGIDASTYDAVASSHLVHIFNLTLITLFRFRYPAPSTPMLLFIPF